ncbi:polysaccharide biosynthesis protein [Prochlorococcus sp. AH-716-E13]|nr:polysaccharide biosynthesis protein [Prochlorococcus sp. AH-716-E13]
MEENIIQKLISASPWKRRLFMLIIDIFIVFSSTFLSYWLTNDSNDYKFKFFPYLVILIISLSVYIFSKQYKGLTRFVDNSLIYRLGIRNIFIFVILLIIFTITNLDSEIKNKTLFLLFTFQYSFSLSIRFFLRDLLINNTQKKILNCKKVAIYGAGSAGAQLSSSLNIAKSHNIVCFIDESLYLQNRSINNIPIISPKEIDKTIKKEKIDQILLAIPSLENNRKRELIKSLDKYNIPVLQVPSLEQIERGEASINNLRPIVIDDLLGRNSVPAYPELLGPGILGKTICITGAGGSIGTELALQILKLNPSRLILLDISEFNLYKLKEKLENSFSKDIKINYVLGNSASDSLIKHIFEKYKVEIVFHVAAYKHVPIVEENPIEGLDNNVNSTFIVAKFAEILGLKKMILISSDKAVRPTNIMGASKRLAELIVQSFADKQARTQTKTCFSIVRFGNVLASSGSVVPFFENQIKNGGPLTVTHKDIMRYFMTIEEAAKLVLQSSSLAKGGEVFLLDMGEPISIISLAKQMIRLSGLTVKDEKNINGDIEIIITGLRPGEKLFEELLIEEKSEQTIHPLIFKAKENYLKSEKLFPELNILNQLISARDIENIYKKIRKLVPEWKQFKL